MIICIIFFPYHFVVYSVQAKSVVKCTPGEYRANGVCSSCKAGSYSASLNSFLCVSCAYNRYSARSSSSCTACASGLTAPIGASSCSSGCGAGQVLSDGGACGNCASGKYSPSAGQLSCSICPLGYFSTSGATDCSPCSPNDRAECGPVLTHVHFTLADASVDQAHREDHAPITGNSFPQKIIRPRHLTIGCPKQLSQLDQLLSDHQRL